MLACISLGHVNLMPDFSFENSFGRNDGHIICGVDEVGRGPLAGPVMATAVIIPANFPTDIIAQIKDSKKLSAKKRDILFEPLIQNCSYSIAEASVAEIDRYNILWASMLAMRRAVAGLKEPVHVALIDGNRVPDPLPCRAIAIVKGDDKSISIAAASIIAKVTRDRFMKALAREHPGYGWEHNAGYGTREHIDALSRLGVTAWHRDSFAPVSQVARPGG